MPIKGVSLTSVQVWDLNNIDADVQHFNALVVGDVACLAPSSRGDNVILCGKKSGAARILNLKTEKNLERQLEHVTDLTKVNIYCARSVLLSAFCTTKDKLFEIKIFQMSFRSSFIVAYEIESCHNFMVNCVLSSINAANRRCNDISKWQVCNH